MRGFLNKLTGGICKRDPVTGGVDPECKASGDWTR